MSGSGKRDPHAPPPSRRRVVLSGEGVTLKFGPAGYKMVQAPCDGLYVSPEVGIIPRAELEAAVGEFAALDLWRCCYEGCGVMADWQRTDLTEDPEVTRYCDDHKRRVDEGLRVMGSETPATWESLTAEGTG